MTDEDRVAQVCEISAASEGNTITIEQKGAKKISKESLWVRLSCLLLLCLQNCTAILAIKYNSRLAASDGLKSLSTIVIVLVNNSVHLNCSSIFHFAAIIVMIVSYRSNFSKLWHVSCTYS